MTDGANTDSSLRMRTTNFPAAYSLGTLHVGPKASLSSFWENPSDTTLPAVRVVEAQGRVSTKPDEAVVLTTEPIASFGRRPDLGPLSSLPSDAILGVRVSTLWSPNTLDDDGLAHVAALSAMEWLSLGGSMVSGITDDGLAHLRELVHIRRLRLSERNTDDAFHHLTGMVSLESLDLTSTQTSDGGLACLCEFPNLKRLDLTNTRVSDAGLSPLGTMVSLEDVNLSRTQVTGAGLEHLCPLVNLRRLCLLETPTADAGLVHLTRLPDLRDLDLLVTQVGDNGMAEIGKLVGLRRLRLPHRTTDAGLSSIEQLVALVDLTIDSPHITDAGLAHLQTLVHLETLHLNSGRITDAGYATLGNLPALRTLTLGPGMRLTEQRRADFKERGIHLLS